MIFAFSQKICRQYPLPADSGYLGIKRLHANSQIPSTKSKHHPLTKEQKAANRQLAKRRIFCEHVIGKLKVFRILSERYRNRQKRFKLRFNSLPLSTGKNLTFARGLLPHQWKRR